MNLIAPQPAYSLRAAAEIRAAILNGSLPPGARIRQEELAARLGVSREPVRHALLLLEREGLVSSVNRGAMVSPVDLPLIGEIYEFREVVEGYVAAKVASRKDFNPAALRRIVAQGRRAARSGPLGRLIALDLAFHNELYLAAGNRVVINVMKTQWDHIRRAMRMTLKVRSYRRQVWNEHAAILQAIARRQPARARKLAASHMRRASLLTIGSGEGQVKQ